MRPFAALIVALLACTRPAPWSAPPARAATGAQPRDAGRRCLPLVSGCGCAYVCALTMHTLDGGVHEVVHDLQDSRLDRATVARWCFDADGHGSPAERASASERSCVEVFFDGSGCGGECVPRADLLRCTLTEGGCTAAWP